MKKNIIILVLLALILILFVGCSGSSTIYSHITYIGDQEIPELEKGFGLYGSVVEFDGVYPGWEGIVPVTIVNGNDRNRLFTLNVTGSSKVKEGFEALPEEYYCWITISEFAVNVSAGDTYQIPVTLAMPKDANYSNKRAEIRIIVRDMAQSGLVQIALENKWFIITAD